MRIDKCYIPHLPFQGFKWKWASFAPTESINDPVVLLGVLFRMEKLEGQCRFSSIEFTNELLALTNDLRDSVGVDLAGRGGERNIMRNSGQYWKALGLIPPDSHGMITLTDFGRKVARHEISQTEFSAITIINHKLPNKSIQSDVECAEWERNGITIYPLKLILSICLLTEYLTSKELREIVVPLSACGISADDCAKFIMWNRNGELDISAWPNCCPASNDKRMAREFLLFLANYGYLNIEKGADNDSDKYIINNSIIEEIKALVQGCFSSNILDVLQLLDSEDIVSSVDRNRVRTNSRNRPNQARFRRDVLSACQRCIITNVTMPEVLEAAHIKPYKYHGEDTIANGFAMRLDIHMLFDTGHLRISPDGIVELSGRARMDYGALIPPRIVIPDFTNKIFLKWRWDNYNGL